MARKQPGIRPVHSSACASLDGRRQSGRPCSCDPSYEAGVYDPARRKYVRRTFKTEAAARAWKIDSLSARNRGAFHAPTSVTVREAGEKLVAGMRAGSIRTRSGDPYKPSTIRSYENVLDVHVYPALGPHKLSALRRPHVQAFAEQLLGDGLDPSTVRNIVMPLRVACRRAIRDGLIQTNPCDDLDLPAVRGKRDRIVPPDQAVAMLAAIPREADRVLWATAFFAGLRRGELMGLDWSAVNLASGVIHVERAWDAKNRVMVEPKSKAGIRDVPLPPVLRDVLAEWKHATGGNGLVFGRTGSAPFDASTVQDRVDRAWKTAGLARLTLQEARHTYASLMIAAGVDAKHLQEFMGHASITVTLDRYGHLFPGGRDDAAAKLDRLLELADTQARLSALD
jgi:integrase